MRLCKTASVSILVVSLLAVGGLFLISSEDSINTSAEESNELTVDGLTYVLTDRGDEEKNTAEISKISTELPNELTIPKYVQDSSGTKYHVTAINATFTAYQNSDMSVTFEDNSGLILPKELFKQSYVKSVKIGEGISLPNSIFLGCAYLESVTLPSTLTAISESAFDGCTKLGTISLGNKVTTIEKGAFSGCSSLSELVLPDSLTKIGSEAFKNCSKLTELNIGPNVHSIGTGVFSGTKISVTISAGLTDIEIGENCLFDDMDVIIIPEENPAFTVENGIVYNKDKSVLLYFPRNITTEDGTFTTSASVGAYAFYNTKLSKITLTDGATSVGNYSFSKSAVLNEVVLPQSVKSLGESVFKDSASLSKVTLPDTLDSLGSESFSGTALTEVTVPSGITSLGKGMFSNCSSLQSVTIPASVTSLGENAFMRCYTLKTVNVSGDLTAIGDSAFSYCYELSTFSLSDSIISIGTSAFAYDSKLIITKLPSKLESVGSNAFCNCSGLKISELPDTLSKIGSRSFYMTGIESIRVGEKTSVAFTVDSSQLEAGKYYAFGGDTLKSIYLNNVSVSNEFYYGTLVEITDTLEKYELGPDFKLWSWTNGIGINAEKKTAYLVDAKVSKFSIPLTVEKLIGTGFQDSNITEIIYEGSSDRIITMETGMQTEGVVENGDSGMFSGCRSLVKVTLPAIILVNNERNTFLDCTSLKDVEIGSVDTLPSSWPKNAVLEKFILHSCKTIESYPLAYYMDLPNNLAATCKSNYLVDSSGKALLSFSGTTSRDTSVIEKIAGKTFVWNGKLLSSKYPCIVPITTDQVVVCLDYGDCKAYAAVNKGAALDLSSYAHPNYTVSKWYTDSEKTTEYSNNVITEATTLYADASIKTFAVTVKVTGGSAEDYEVYSDDKKISSGDKVSVGSVIKIVATVKEGYKLSVTSNPSITKTTSDGEFRFTGGIAKDTTFTVKYTQNKVTLKFDTDGADNISNISNKLPGTDYTKPADPVKTGYKFVGWSPALPDKIPANLSTTGNVTYTYLALWMSEKVTISFDTVGGDPVDPVTRSYNTTYGSLPVPVRDGYTFAGWYTAAESGEKVKSTDVATSLDGVKFYATWTINQYTISFDTDGGSPAVSEIRQDYGTKVSAPTDTVLKTGYTFQYWSLDGKEYEFATIPAENITLKAQWKANQYTITFDTDGGSSIAPITQDYGTAITVPATTLNGYTLAKWDPAVPATMPAENISVKAVWIINAKSDETGSVSIDVGSEGGTFFVPASSTKTVNISLGSNTSVKVESASDLAGKTVVTEVKVTSNPTPNTVAGNAYEFVLTADGTQYNGKILVTLPYTWENGKQAAVYYWNGTEAEKVNVVGYDYDSVTFETSHNSTYIVGSEDKEDSVNGLLVLIIVAIVLAVIVFGCAYYSEVVKKRNA